MGRLTKFLLSFAFFWLILWGLASFSVPRIARAVLPRLESKAEGTRIAVQRLDFDKIELSPTLVRLSISNLSARFDLRPKDKRNLRSSFEAAEMIVYINRPLRRRGGIVVDDFEVLFDPSDRPQRLPFDGFSKGYMHIHSLPLTDPHQAMVEILDGLEELFLENKLVGDFEFSGEVLVRIDDSTMPALVYTVRQGDHFRLRFSKPDIEKIAKAADVDLSDDQIDLVSAYPVRVPALIRITDEARDYSQQEFPRQPWLEDALRHVSWSYLLTREFGAEFALQVTDAYEKRPGNTPNEHLMDYNNNAVGRIFAEDGTPYGELPLHVLAHADIVRNPEEVEMRAQLLR